MKRGQLKQFIFVFGILILSSFNVYSEDSNKETTMEIIKEEIASSQDNVVEPELTPLVKDNIFRGLYEWIISLFSKIESKNNLEIKEINITEKKIEKAIKVPIDREPPKKAISVPFQRDPAPNWILEKAKKYIISYVGENYFNEHISLKQSWTEETLDKIGAKYRVVYDYGFKVKDETDEKHLQFSLFFDENGDLVPYRGIKYRGPQKPYQFRINRSEALEIAKEAGLPQSTVEIIEKGKKNYNITKLTTATIRFALGFNANEGGIRESYVWYVTTENFKFGKPEVVYIDVDTGEILGGYRRKIAVVGLQEEQRKLIEELIKEEDPQILEKTFLYSAETTTDKPNQLKLLYTSRSAIPEAPQVLIIIDLVNKKIISIEKRWWDRQNEE